LHGLRTGDNVAAQELWNRYFARLVAVAHSRLRGLARDSSGEDVALSALKSVMLGVQANRFPNLTDGTGLWPLLVTITARKAIKEVRRQLANKRSPNAERRVPDLESIIGDEPSPEFAVEVADELERLVRRFDDPMLRTIAQRKLEGFTNTEIAKELGVSTRTVIRKLGLIRQELDEEAGGDSVDSMAP
jgi:DNA-directed RNA polymerase specialized sigma24 family protein